MKRKEEFFIAIMLNGIMDKGMFSFLPLVIELADMLPRISGELQETLKEAQLVSGISTIMDYGFNELIHDMLATAHNGCDCNKCKGEMLSMECVVLNKLSFYQLSINCLKNEYPIYINFIKNFLMRLCVLIIQKNYFIKR